jgi:hypothetical protein
MSASTILTLILMYRYAILVPIALVAGFPTGLAVGVALRLGFLNFFISYACIMLGELIGDVVRPAHPSFLETHDRFWFCDTDTFHGWHVAHAVLAVYASELRRTIFVVGRSYRRRLFLQRPVSKCERRRGESEHGRDRTTASVRRIRIRKIPLVTN